MCGIAGVVGVEDSAADREAVEAMSACLARRGPDDQGIEAWPDAVLAHRRLSIFDLSSAGRQPMRSECGTAAISFNGAIYNFLELRDELERGGARFRSRTDTEVLLEGYKQWGLERLLERIRGMFAFALWDITERKLFLVRDRLGVKPLIYRRDGARLWFASSVRAVVAAGPTPEPDPEAVAEYLEYGYVPDPSTIYDGVKKLPAASVLEWSGGRTRRWIYWSPPTAANRRIGFEEALEETTRLFVAAVKKRLFADVPVGSLLSGGIDSSLVSWAVAELGGDVTAFTVATPGEPGDEGDDARATARRLGVRHEVLTSSAADIGDLDEFVAAYGEPFACASGLGMLKLSKVVTGSATALLTGDGGDDVFLGYPEHRHLWWAQRIARLTPAPAADLWRRLRKIEPGGEHGRRLRRFVDYVTGGLGAVADAHEGLPAFRADGLLGERLQGRAIRRRAIPWSLVAGRKVLTEFLEFDRGLRFVGEYLTKVDGATMHHGLEARSPFLDTDLWEFAASLPYALRLHRNRPKALLRELARRKLGDRVGKAPKRGFTIPVNSWLAGPWRAAVEERLRDGELARQGWLDGDALLKLLHTSASKGTAPNRLWYSLVLENWLRSTK